MAEQPSTAKPGQYLTFLLDGQTYGVAIQTIREINQISDITPVPKSPAYVQGVINLRGKIVPVVDLRVRLSLKRSEYTKQTCIVILESAQGQVGVIVDRVCEVIDLLSEQIESPPSLSSDPNSVFLIGMGKSGPKVILLLDVVRALAHDGFLFAENTGNAA